MKLKVSIVALLGVASPCFCNAVPGTKPGDFGYFHGLEPRVLKAATPKAALASRGLKVSLQHELQLHYVDDNELRQDGASFGAQVSLQSKLPTLLLEGIEHLLESVDCNGRNMRVAFLSAAYDQAKGVIEEHGEFLVVTSHYGCNDEGSRLSNRVSHTIFRDNDNTIELIFERVTWDKHYNMTVSFGGIEEPYNINRHDHLRRRAPVYHAVDATAITTTPSLSSAVVSSLSTISSQVVFPTPDVSAAATATSAIGAIATSYINTPILPPAVVGGALDGLSVLGLSPPDGLTVSCLNCSTFGGLVLTRGQFSTSSQPQNASAFAKHEQRDVIDDMEDMISYIEHGFVELQTTGNVGAHIELETLWTPVAGVAYAVSLATFPLSPFIIPDVAVVGPQVRLQLVLAATLSIPLNFTYGFSVSVPDNATAIAAFNPVNASTVTGFDKTTFSALPFSAHVGGVDLNLSATFRPEVLVGVNLLNGAATAGAGVFLDLPRVGVSVQHVKGVDANCNPSTDANLVGSIDSHFGPLARVVPEVALAAGVVAQANLSLAKIGVQAAWTPLATNFPAPTSCLAFDKGASGYKTAAAALAAATSSSAATPGRVMGMRQGWSVAQGLAMALLVGLLAGFILL